MKKKAYSLAKRARKFRPSLLQVLFVFALLLSIMLCLVLAESIKYGESKAEKNYRLEQQVQELERKLQEAKDQITFNPENLLKYTNKERVKAGKAPLKLNKQLSESALAKVKDMHKRGYWSHNTPDGEEPWVFLDSAGYKFLKAGENLAFGFDTGQATTDGWMMSPAHKDNLLDTRFTEVGFGVLRNVDFQDSPSQTLVVAHYGLPQI